MHTLLTTGEAIVRGYAVLLMKSRKRRTARKNYVKDSNIAAQVILPNDMFERFLERMSKSKYRDKFVIKGGMLIAAVVGLDTISTMDS